MQKRFLAALAGATLVAAAAVGTASAGHSWGNYHWARTANPFTIQLGDNLSESWKDNLAWASSDWTRATVLDTRVVAGQARGKCRPTAGRAEVCNGNYGFNGWLGLAQIWINGSHITQATTKVNDTYLSSSSYSETNRQHVMCQEIGHDFGLGHQDESGADLNTCMDYSNALDNPSPDQHDYDQLGTIYNSHLDSTTTIAVGAAGSDAKPERVDRVDRISDSEVTEHFADGTKKITHVFWAVPGAARNHDHDHGE